MPTKSDDDNDLPEEESEEDEDRPRFRHVWSSEAFGPQPTPSSELPDPGPFALTLVGGILECVHGLRDPAQFSRWVNEDVFRAVTRHANRIATHSSRMGKNKQRMTRPQFRLGNVVINNPRDGIVEASIVVHGPARVRAVALRLEGLDHRWQATSFSML
jgi:hypothetical protein